MMMRRKIGILHLKIIMKQEQGQLYHYQSRAPALLSHPKTSMPFVPQTKLGGNCTKEP